jgi:transcriptional regulator with XRE-family HTH domain
VAKWETDVQVPSGENLVRLARVLGCTPAAILGAAEEERPEDVGYVADGSDQLAQLLETMDASARHMTLLGPPGQGRLQKLGVLNGIREIIVESGKPVPGWWNELREKVESGAI